MVVGLAAAGYLRLAIRFPFATVVTMPQPLTRQQRRTLDALRRLEAEGGYRPSYREVARALGLSSPATVHAHLRTLERKGYLRREPDGSLSPVRGVEVAAALELPLAGTIAAGSPIEAIAGYETIAVPTHLVPDPNAFVLRVRGDSMVDDGILDGDFVIVERNFYPRNGDVVVALVDNSAATLKRYFREAGQVRLQPANARVAPLFVKNPAIQGIVRAILRKFIPS